MASDEKYSQPQARGESHSQSQKEISPPHHGVQVYRLADLIYYRDPVRAQAEQTVRVPLPDFVPTPLEDMDPFLLGEMSHGELEIGEIAEETVVMGSSTVAVADAKIGYGVVVSEEGEETQNQEKGFVMLVFTAEEGRVIVHSRPDEQGRQTRTHINVRDGLVVVAPTSGYIEVAPGRAKVFELEGLEEPSVVSFRFLSNARRLSDSRPAPDHNQQVRAAA